MTFETSSDKRVNFLYKKYARSASTTTRSASVSGEATEMRSRGPVCVTADIYAKSPSSTATPTVSGSWTASGSNVQGPAALVDVSAATAADLAAAHGLTEDIWQAFKDGELVAAHTTSDPLVVKIERLATRHVTSTQNMGTSPSFYHPCLFDCIPSTAYGRVYAVEITGMSGAQEVVFTSTDDGAWVLQPESGVLQFMDSAGSTGPRTLFGPGDDAGADELFNLGKTPAITFYRYVGPKLDEYLTYAELGDGKTATFGGGLQMSADGDGVHIQAVAGGNLVISSTADVTVATDLTMGSVGITASNECLVAATPSLQTCVLVGGTTRGFAETATAGGLYDVSSSRWFARGESSGCALAHAGTDRLTTTGEGVQIQGSVQGAASLIFKNSETTDHDVSGWVAGNFMVCYDKYVHADSAYGLTGFFDSTTCGGLVHYDGGRGWGVYYHEGNVDSALTCASLTVGSAKAEQTLYGVSRKYLQATSGAPRGFSVDGNVALLTAADGTPGLWSQLDSRWHLSFSASDSTLFGANDATYLRATGTGIETASDVTADTLIVDGTMLAGGDIVATAEKGSKSASAPVLVAASFSSTAKTFNSGSSPSFQLAVSVPGTYVLQVGGSMYITATSYDGWDTDPYDAAANILLVTGRTYILTLSAGGASVTRTSRMSTKTSMRSPALPMHLEVTVAAAGTLDVNLSIKWSTNYGTSSAYIYGATAVLMPSGSFVVT